MEQQLHLLTKVTASLGLTATANALEFHNPRTYTSGPQAKLRINSPWANNLEHFLQKEADFICLKCYFPNHNPFLYFCNFISYLACVFSFRPTLWNGTHIPSASVHIFKSNGARTAPAALFPRVQFSGGRYNTHFENQVSVRKTEMCYIFSK